MMSETIPFFMLSLNTEVSPMGYLIKRGILTVERKCFQTYILGMWFWNSRISKWTANHDLFAHILHSGV